MGYGVPRKHHHFAKPRCKFLAGPSEGDARPVSKEKVLAQFAFELADPKADGGGRNPEFLGRARKIPMPGARFENTQGFQGRQAVAHLVI
jgi:hypothetical protein